MGLGGFEQRAPDHKRHGTTQVNNRERPCRTSSELASRHVLAGDGQGNRTDEDPEMQDDQRIDHPFEQLLPSRRGQSEIFREMPERLRQPSASLPRRNDDPLQLADHRRIFPECISDRFTPVQSLVQIPKDASQAPRQGRPIQHSGGLANIKSRPEQLRHLHVKQMLVLRARYHPPTIVRNQLHRKSISAGTGSTS